MTDMRTVALAWESRATDVNKYNAAGAITALATCAVEVTNAQLSAALVPTYIKLMPLDDAWGNRWRLRADSAFGDAAAAHEYVIWSAGRNGTSDGSAGFDATATSAGERHELQRRHHLLCVVFVQYPEGLRTQ